ncbi:MAG: NADH-quinone oxidoreductase subunit I [Nocardiopsaceae bacterium]|jgi:NADH:ubiquinone oxidoreductase subunit F (NADH-binding)|nr:NADH-quinone oxidoreductase subunit I [Nocardiopsaceae bacterium]
MTSPAALAHPRFSLTEPLPVPAPGAGPAQLPRLLPRHGAVPVRLTDHLRAYGPVPYRGRSGHLIREAAAAGLTGRGGAAFPVHRKLAAVAGAPEPVVIGNGAEGEPASNKDKSLLWISPHLVLDGLQLAAEAVGSLTIGLYVHRNPRLLRHLQVALAERVDARADRAPVELIEAPSRFLAGEASSLASVVTGGAALPRLKDPRLSERGVAGRPTLVQNVETLAHLALIARYGAGWFRAVGTSAEPGSMLTTLYQASGRADVTEAALGTPLADLLSLAGAGAVLVGGYHGAWLATPEAAGLRLSNATLRPAGAFVGAGVLAALPAGRCGLAETARVVRYLALESAGQCGPCFNGLPRMAAALSVLALPEGPRAARRGMGGRWPDRAAARADLERWTGLVEGRGACHHPDGTARLVRSALRVFAAEAGLHCRGQCTGTEARPFLPLPPEPAIDAADWS